jgi:hypothetical protein
MVGKGAQVRGASPVKLPRRKFLHLTAGTSALENNSNRVASIEKLLLDRSQKNSRKASDTKISTSFEVLGNCAYYTLVSISIR